MDWLSLIGSGLLGAGIVSAIWAVERWCSDKSWEAIADALEADREFAFTHLHNLRRNAFITNERGHRVRYVNASPECRAKAEQ